MKLNNTKKRHCYPSMSKMVIRTPQNVALYFHRIRAIHSRYFPKTLVDSSWNVMAHGDARKGKWRGNWWMEWVASTLHTSSKHGVSSITTADAHTSAASSGLNWRPRRFKWTRPFRRKAKSGFCACDITFQLASNSHLSTKRHISTGWGL
jgi:hypothetical protein